MPQRHPQIEIGRYHATVGGPSGTRLTPRADGKDLDALASALREPSRRRDPPPGDDEPVTVVAREAEALELFTALADGSLFANAEVLPRIGQILDLLERLDRAGRYDETLRLARAITGPLLLLQRWTELLHALDAARGAADAIDDLSGLAWAQHELGTLQLAAGDHVGAEARLGQAQTLRQQLGERRALAATQHNLGVLCQRLREQLHDDSKRPVISAPGRGLLALVVAAVLPLVLAAAAYAVLVPSPPGASRLTVNISGHGLVTSKPDGIQCQHTCTRELQKGDTLSLTARGGKGWHFQGWSGGCHGRNPCAPASDASTTVTATFARKANQPPECRDHKDNDRDGLIDHGDPGCDDGTELPRQPPSECGDHKDNDRDGLTDDRDPGCDDDGTELPRQSPSECGDHKDNDRDGLTDDRDPGCDDDGTELPRQPPSECGDHKDNDRDGLTDDRDPGCDDDGTELPRQSPSECGDHKDNDRDGLTDDRDPGCDDDGTELPRQSPSECGDHKDNDRDGLTDDRDPGCDDDGTELPRQSPSECGDHKDNDRDGLTDDRDPGCRADETELPRQPLPECQDHVDNDGDTLLDQNDPGCADGTEAPSEVS